MDHSKRKRQAVILKLARKVHRTAGALLFVFFFITACTGLLLGWKKHTGGLILADTQKGRSSDPADWLPLHVLKEKAQAAFKAEISADISPAIDRIDFRPDKGIAKFIFVEEYWGIQLDCTTGEALKIERRRSDFIENIHDGVILDKYLGTNGEPIKLAYTSVMGVALLLFTTTGFWLWYGPKHFRASNRRKDRQITRRRE
jgi:uncharacterized iron-regulated membrane protein